MKFYLFCNFLTLYHSLVLEERYPEWCLLKFTASGSLLLSTRSNAIIDVFDSSGGYCYTIAVVSFSLPFFAEVDVSFLKISNKKKVV